MSNTQGEQDELDAFAMGSSSPLGSLLLVFGLVEVHAGFIPENCTDYGLQFERVFSVPGEAAMLNTTLVSPDVFDFRTVPYNVTWFNSKTGREISNLTGRLHAAGETLWLLNTTRDDSGDYVGVVRTPSKCYMQATKLIVDLPSDGECGRPQKTEQMLTKGAHDKLHCPLKDYISKLDSYNIPSSLQWFKGCDPIVDGTGGYEYRSKTKLTIKGVKSHHSDSYTCTLTFTLGGTTGSVSESIIANVIDLYSLVPQVHNPANTTIKAKLGSNLTQRCLVFVPGIGQPFIDVWWWVGNEMIFNMHPSDGIYTSLIRSWSEEVPKIGTWIERLLMLPALREEDLNTNYTCRVQSSRGHPEAYFTLQPEDPNIMLPIGLVLCGVMVLFIISVILFYTFKIDIVLSFRRAFPVFYKCEDSDGKLFDAYVAYPQPHAHGYSKEVEVFALQTLPHVLENKCDYKLFIAGRDCLPGQAIVDSVEENLQASRRFLLLYNASTFTGSHADSLRCNNNNTISDERDCNVKSKTNKNLDGCEKVYPNNRQQLECVEAMHRALLERSLKVILVELEEVSPAQMAHFPESVRHLRRKQGAVHRWKNRRTKTCMSCAEDEEKAEDSRSSSRFWKEIRYHMPVRGKRKTYPEKTALLNL
ncbi:interleukin-1 receptor type 1-like [Gouania willdenowi]|uniref:Interleukin-1 receptor type 1-like n=1 Tax=Gouania willdenowi TaxID=441366 RepID=A0A8C5DXS6_GOUWI|nr:interleukin-1 receptor type 1-like [Gouania willdenowi]